MPPVGAALNLSPHFTLEELVTNGNHPDIPNDLPEGWQERIQTVANKLEKVRGILGVPLHISYGYRSPALNAACGGSETSDHMQALAVDFNPVGISRGDAFRKLWEDESFMVSVDQMILERGCIHIGLGSRVRHEGRGDRPYPLLAVWPKPLPAFLR